MIHAYPFLHGSAPALIADRDAMQYRFETGGIKF
jgi:hypothetical protein